MTSGESRFLSIGPLTIGLHLPPAIENDVRRELEPFIEISRDRPDGALLVELDLRLEAVTREWRDATDGESMRVDTSLYKHLASDGLRFPVPGGYVVRIELTQTHAFFESERKRVSVYQPDASLLVLDGVRTIKSLFTPAVERHGGVQLHAAAVTVDDGRAVLLLGDMWQGKTTLLLELLSQFHVQQLSCDTVVLLPSAGGGVSAHGWPSPFSVSHGTLSDHPELASFFSDQRRSVPYDTLWREGKKTILSSHDVVQRFGTRIVPHARELAHCVVVRFRPDEPTGLTAISDANDLASTLRSVYLGSRDPIYHNWHRFLHADDALIESNIEAMSKALIQACAVTVMTWAPSAISLLKRIPDLGRAHKHLGHLLTSFPPL
ncbi:MAG TPA: hypothetical protein VN380_06875 [Thermoanaerobaculia bacterium]|jgi:hypothetical protein|nr:hypothetical protein [Thermoanaerobaculia bacterium]